MDESQKIKIIIIRRAPRPCGACPTQPYKCSQNVKVKINLFISASAKTVFDVDFNIKTAFKDRIGHAPKGRGALLIIFFYFLFFIFYF